MAAVALLLVGCSVPTAQHVGQSSAGLFFDVPKEWTAVEPALVTKAQSSWSSSDSGQAYLDALKWQTVMSSNAQLTTAEAFANSAPDSPVVYAAVRSLYDVEAQNVSSDVLTALQDVVLPVSLSANGDGLDVSLNQSYLQNGLNGVRQQMSWTVGGVRQTIDTRLVLGMKQKLLFIFWVRCSDTCRSTNEVSIQRALDSLTVKEPSVA
jgi:hypothetical protein